MLYKKDFWLIVLIAIALIVTLKVDVVLASEKYYFSSFTNAGKDTGYSEQHKIDKKDPHYGWELGQFVISGFSSKHENSEQSLVFLKNNGDKLILDFNLNHDLDALNKNEKLILSHDDNGYDLNFGIERTDFGRGALIIKHTDYQNKAKQPQIHTDYLTTVESQADGRQIEIFEEGDYEIALDYEIEETKIEVFGFKPFSSYTNYRLSFNFSVRNGNVMFFPFDVETGSELANRDYTENGFYIDFAKSQYLDISIKKEELNDGATGLIEDTRFNRPVKDGESYLEEGIYTITAKSNYIDQETVKVIYVGTSNILKAHVVNNISLDEINDRLRDGAYIDDFGTILELTGTTPGTSSEDNVEVSEEDFEESLGREIYMNKTLIYSGVSIIVIAILFSTIIKIRNNKKKRKSIENIRGE